MLGGGPSRLSRTARPVPSLASGPWTTTLDETGTLIRFIPQSGVVVTDSGPTPLVIAAGRVSRPGQPANQARLFAMSRLTGQVVWSAPLSSPVLDSNSTPVVDAQHRTVTYGSGRMVTTFALADGQVVWQRQLTRNIVNASPVVTTDLWPANRMFITDFHGGATSGRLYCINIDPRDSALNPYDPGEIVWSVVLGGTSGNTPAYAGGVVYVATNGTVNVPPMPNDPGTVRAYPASATTAPAPLWTFTNVIAEGFYGGLCVTPPEGSGAPPWVYAASYAFDTAGGMNSANMVKLNGLTGELAWSVPTNRTSSIPVPLAGGRIAVSGGVRGYGTVPTVSLYEDHGTWASLLWDSVTGTWHDDNQNGLIDEGEYLPVGGWSVQPVVSQYGGRTMMLVGVPPDAASSAASEDLFVLDLDAPPSSPEFVAQHVHGPGHTAAIAGSNAFSTGADGLFCFGPTPEQLDINADTVITVDDLYAWESGEGLLDVDGDGVVSPADRALVIQGARGAEAGLRGGGSP